MTKTEVLDRADRRLGIIQWILGALAVCLVILGFWSGHLTSQENRALKDIQASRIEVTWNTCRSQNARNKNTKASLDLILKKVPAAQKQRANASRVATGLLIDALAPHQNCERLLRGRFGVPHP